MPKSEKEKCLVGEPYLASDAELVAERMNARRLTRLFNISTEGEVARRVELLTELFGGIGGQIEVEPPFHCDYGYNIFVGNNFYMNFGCVILDCHTVRIGDNVLCGPYVQIYAAHHPVSTEVRAFEAELSTPITIGNNVWIGGGTIICPGVTIGDNVTIGAGSVVTRDIPSNVLAVGNPCRVVRELA